MLTGVGSFSVGTRSFSASWSRGRGRAVATRCTGITKGGTRCTLTATDGPYCYQHSPAFAEERKRSARRGGRAGGNGRRGGVAEVEDIKREIHRVIDGVADGTVTTGAVLFMGFNTLLRAVEVGRKIREQDEIISRLDALEAAEATEAQGRAWRR